MPGLTELELVRRIRESLGIHRQIAIGPGDDCALLRTTGDTLITTDMIIEGSHFDFRNATSRHVGRKAMNVNISDIASMAGRPTFAVVSVGLGSDRDEHSAMELFLGLKEAADRFGVAIVGGDTNKSPSGTVISTTLLGFPTGRGPVLRSGARPGDAVFVTGRLGYSLLGRHLDFVPRVKEAERLHNEFTLHAMIDLSDGLGNDLFHICNESNVGAIIEADRIPIADGKSDDRSPLEHALNDGEDFELLFTVPESDAKLLDENNPLADFGVELTRIGSITGSRDVLITKDGKIESLKRGGFEHRW